MKNETETKKNTVITKTNPNKVNQHTDPDPRQALFLSLYLDPKSPSFGNAMQSALDAKYTKSYAKKITGVLPGWLGENVRQMDMLAKAERNLNALLDLEEVVPAMGAFGPILQNGKRIGTKKVAVKDDAGKIVKLKNGKTKYKSEPKYERIPVMRTDSRLLTIKKDATHFIAERIGRMVYTKTTHTPFDPGDPNKKPVVVPIQININEDREKYA